MSRFDRWGKAVLVGAVLASGAAQAERLSLAQAIERAREANVDVKQARTEVEKARAQLDAASVLLHDNPEFNGSAGPRYVDDARFLKLSMQLLQPVEIAGQRPARIRAAKAQLEQARQHLASVELEVTAKTVEAWLAVLSSDAQLRASEAAVDVARRASQAVRERFEAGTGTQIDVNSALVELGQAQRDLLTAKRDAQNTRAGLAELLQLKTVADLQPTVPLERLVAVLVDALTRELPSYEAAVERALAQRPDLAAARLEWEAASATRDVANRTAVPTPAIGVGFERDGEERVYFGALTVALPVFDRNQGDRAEARARASQAAVALQALEQQIRREIQVALARMMSAREVVGSFEGEINAAAAENLTLAEEAYRSGKMNLIEVLAIQRSSLETRRAYVEALEELAAATTELSRAMGRAPTVSDD